jgi:hypothetical protein
VRIAKSPSAHRNSKTKSTKISLIVEYFTDPPKYIRHPQFSRMVRLKLRNTSLYRRYCAMNQLEVLRAANYTLRAKRVLLFATRAQGAEMRRKLLLLALICFYQKYPIERQILYTPPTQPEEKYLRFFNTEPSNCPIDYRFRLDQLPRLLRCLRITSFVMDNGVWVNPQEALLILLHRLAYPCRWTSMAKIFGGEFSRLSRIFSTLRTFILNRCACIQIFLALVLHFNIFLQTQFPFDTRTSLSFPQF